MITIVYKKSSFNKQHNFCFDKLASQDNLTYLSSRDYGQSNITTLYKEEFRHIVGVSSLLALSKKKGGRGQGLCLLKGDLEKKLRVFAFALLQHSTKTKLALFNLAGRKTFKILSLALFRDFVLATTLKLKAKKLKEEMLLQEKELCI